MEVLIIGRCTGCGWRVDVPHVIVMGVATMRMVWSMPSNPLDNNPL